MTEKLREIRHLDTLNEVFEEYVKEIILILERTKVAVLTSDTKVAFEVIELEQKINQDSYDLHDSIVEYLALFSPMGINLRKIVAYLQIRTELERLSDHCKKIMREVIQGIEFSEHTHKNVEEMFNILDVMITKTLTSIVAEDVTTIKEVQKLDKDIAVLFKKEIDKAEQKNLVYAYFALFKQLERIGDNIKNIYEQSYYIKKGQFYEM